MKLNKVTTITKKQAKAYTALALRNLSVSPNDITIKFILEEIDEVMKLYKPSQATIELEKILKENKTIWKKF